MGRPAHAMQCRHLFDHLQRNRQTVSLNHIYAGQTSVGHHYALFKALRDAGLDPHFNISVLGNKKIQKIINSLLKELSSSIPVVIDPQGRIFALDQHHDIFALSLFSPQALETQMPVRVVRDYSIGGTTMEEFKRSIVEHGWVYARNVDDVIDIPRSIGALENSNERSVVGLAFVELSQSFKIPFKGKHFVPFIQFLLADFIVAHREFKFKKSFSQKDVSRVAQLILSDVEVKTFLREHLKEDSPDSLRRFLQQN